MLSPEEEEEIRRQAEEYMLSPEEVEELRKQAKERAKNNKIRIILKRNIITRQQRRRKMAG